MPSLISIAGLVLMGLLITDPGHAQDSDDCPYPKGGIGREIQDLAATLKAHAEWAENRGWFNPEVSGRANLCNANLLGANLKRADLGEANLEGADLRLAKLEGAYLGGANLKGANLERAYLIGAKLVGANLEGADLGWANLYGAKLVGANLEEAYLVGACRLRRPVPHQRLPHCHLGADVLR